MRVLYSHFVMLSKTTALILVLLHATADAYVYHKEIYLRSCDPRRSQCVSLRECTALHDKLQALGNGMKGLHFLRDRMCSIKGSSVKVCCDVVSKSVLQSATASKRLFQYKVHDLYQKKKTVVNRNDCGRVVNDHIFLGQEESKADFKDFPWMAILMFENSGSVELRSMCGGTLVSDQHILTVAHCVDPKIHKLLRVRFGFQNQTCQSCMEYYIRKIILHENYSPKTLQNDIALLYLERPVRETGKIVPICLPIPELMINEGKFTKNMMFTAVRYNSSEDSIVPKKTNVVLQNDEFCSSYNHKMPDGQKCVKNRGICQGDSGSAVVYPVRASGNKYQLKIFQMGIISSGYSECAPDTPLRMISVNYYLDWILEHISK